MPNIFEPLTICPQFHAIIHEAMLAETVTDFYREPIIVKSNHNPYYVRVVGMAKDGRIVVVIPRQVQRVEFNVITNLIEAKWGKHYCLFQDHSNLVHIHNERQEGFPVDFLAKM